MFLIARTLPRSIYLCGRSSFQRYQAIRLSHSGPTEAKITVPWGHIAGLHWNASSSAIPILCLHGWKDNASSFNRIIPEILQRTSKFQFLAIDLPGHGFSSHYPQGMLYQVVDSMIAIRRVMRYFGWAEQNHGIHFMGHSLGAMLSFIFAASHPTLVDCVIAIDALVPVMFTNADNVTMIKHMSDGILNTETDAFFERQSQTYERSELLDKLLKSHMMSLNTVACETLLTRAIVETPPNSGKYRFSHDPRIQFYPLMGISADQSKVLAECFRSNLLHIKADDGVNYLSAYMQKNLKHWLEKDNMKVMEFIHVKEALHHVHLIEPEKIVCDIVRFLGATH